MTGYVRLTVVSASVTVTTGLKLPAADGVPDTVRPLADVLVMRPGGKLVTDQTEVPVLPALVTRVDAYTNPTWPPVGKMSGLLIVSCDVAVRTDAVKTETNVL